MPTIEREKKTYSYVKKNGKRVVVPQHSQKYHTKSSFDEIQEEMAKDLYMNRAYQTHPDTRTNAKKMFWKSNEYWKENMATTDRLGIDGNEPPEVDEKPDFGMPYEVVQFEGRAYYADETGKFYSKRKMAEKSLEKETKKDKLEYYTELGGNRWQKYGKDRIYFSKFDLAKLLGYEWTTYNTGNISTAKHNGEKISNSEMKRVLADLDSNVYYDVKEEKFHWKTGVGTGGDYTEEAIEKLKEY